MPEFDQLRSENSEIKAILSLINKRLDDMNDHIFDLSRRVHECNKRIDELRAELKEEINKNAFVKEHAKEGLNHLEKAAG